ncbi:MAG: hypothetical protein FJ148_09270 [Deltaproteobacteria bacterium]|nr:hypothetical protein [Deltaproteobacteria bacterium]
MTADDRDREFADLLSAVIARHTVARRLRGATELAEEVLGAAMRVGDAVRRALRDGVAGRPDASDCEQLAQFARRLDRATDAVLAEPLVADLRRASASGDPVTAARLALEVFAGLARPEVVPPRLYTGVTARRRSRSGETLVHPIALAEELAARSRDGIAPASGDDDPQDALPEPIALSPSFDGCGAEIALVSGTDGLEDALLEDLASGDLLVFCGRLERPFTIALAEEAGDEWWAASAFRWPDYRAQLADALRARQIDSAIVR